MSEAIKWIALFRSHCCYIESVCEGVGFPN